MNSEYNTYTFIWPSYRLKNFERDLGVLEVQSLFANRVSSRRGCLVTRSPKTVTRETLRNLTSFRKILVSLENGDSVEVLPDQMLLERAAPLVRMAKTNRDIDKLFTEINKISLKKREKQYLMHELHPYKGRYYPQLIKPLLNATAKQGDVILDPFCGCGTTLLECYLSRMSSIGVDLNPIAFFISKVRMKCIKMKNEQLRRTVERLLKRCRRDVTIFRNRRDHRTLDQFTQINALQIDRIKKEVPHIPNIHKWFSEGVIEELMVIVDNIMQIEDEDERDFCALALSSIVKRVSNWDPEQVRQRLLKKPRENVLVFEIFERQLKKFYLIIYAYSKIRSKLHIEPECFSEVHLHDSRHLEFIEDDSVDAVVTSPPYATALSYIDTDRLPMVVLGLMEYRSKEKLKKIMIGERDITPKDRDRLEDEFLNQYDSLLLPRMAKETIRKILEANRQESVGFRRKNKASTLYRYFKGMRECLLEMKRVLKEGGYCSIIIGSNRTKAGGTEVVRIQTHDILAEMAKSIGFKHVKTIPMAPTSPYMIHVNNRINDEYVLIFQL